MEYIVKVFWDSESEVYLATSEVIPGLVLESGSYDALIERVKHAVPELLKLNNLQSENVNIRFVSERICTVSVY